MAEAGGGAWRARLALAWLASGEWRAHPGRVLLTTLAIAVGVALGFAVHLVNGSALASFEGAVAGVNGAADLQVVAASALGLPDRLYPTLARTPGVADASPVVVLPAHAGGVALTLLGLDALRVAQVTPSLLGVPAVGEGADRLFAPDALFLSRAAMAALGTRPRGEVRLAAHGRVAAFRVAGTLPGAAAGERIGVIDIAAAQARFARPGRLDRIDLRAPDRATASAALRPLLPPGAQIATGATRAAQGDALSRAYRVNLDMLALVALLTGGFLVFSAQSLSVARRLRQFALLRTLGLARRGVIAAVVVEGLGVGLVGGGLGLLLGYGLASAALHLLGGDLGAGYFAGADAQLHPQPLAALVFFLLGMLAAGLGSLFPALVAARAAPAVSLRNPGDAVDPRTPVPWLPAVLLIAAGIAAALLPPVGGLPWFGFAAMALLLAGAVAAVPWGARLLLAPVAARARAGAAAMLALRHLAGAPSEAATALCGIVASTALTVAMATMVTSFRGAVADWLDDVLAADLFVRTTGGGLSPEVQARLARVPGVKGIAFSRQLPLTLRPDRPPVILIARQFGAGTTPLVLLRGTITPSPGVTPVWVSEPAARLYGWQIGTRLSLPIGRGAQVTVAGIWRDYARQAGAVALAARDYDRLTGDRDRDEASVTLAPGATAAAVSARLRAVAGGQLDVSEPRTLRRYALALFDRSFTVTYALEAVAVLVGLAGVAATVSGQTVARAREFGMLRHLGLARRQVLAMLGVEGALLGLVGGLVGVVAGLALAEVLIHVINPQSFNWTMTTRLPMGLIAGLATALVGAAGVTAVAAGRRATAQSALLAVREDW